MARGAPVHRVVPGCDRTSKGDPLTSSESSNLLYPFFDVLYPLDQALLVHRNQRREDLFKTKQPTSPVYHTCMESQTSQRTCTTSTSNKDVSAVHTLGSSLNEF